MVSRKKKDPAALRTVGLFTGKTVLEEAEQELEEAEDVTEAASWERPNDPKDMVDVAENTAVRWLGLDVFHEGDDVKVAVHAKGHAVLVFVGTHGPKGAPCSTATFKISAAQWRKLKNLARAEP